MLNVLRGIAINEKKPIIIEFEGNKIKAYDKDGYRYITNEEKKQYRSLKTPYILIVKDEKEDSTKTLKEIYDQFITDADELKKCTDGLVNMYKSGRDTQTAVKLAYFYLNKNQIKAEDIEQYEVEFLENASYGALTFADKYEGQCFKYDINSSYPSIYSSQNFLCPIKKGTLKKITKEEFNKMTFYKMGIYRAIIKHTQENQHKIFKINPKNYYTHIDLNYAKSLSLNITLINDDKPNYLEYNRDDCKTGYQMFNEYVKLLYPLRKNKIIKKRVKSLLRCLWGALSSFNIITKIVSIDEDFTIERKQLISQEIISKDKYKVQFIPSKYINTPYETPYARIKAFLLSKGREKIGKLINSYGCDHVVRCHTDSMMMTVDMDIPTSLKLGDLKYEGYCENVKIININKVIGDFYV